MDKLVIVISKGKDAILDHFDRTAELERSLQERKKNDLLDEVETVSRMADIISVRQKEALGLGHAVLQAKDAVGANRSRSCCPMTSSSPTSRACCRCGTCSKRPGGRWWR